MDRFHRLAHGPARRANSRDRGTTRAAAPRLTFPYIQSIRPTSFPRPMSRIIPVGRRSRYFVALVAALLAARATTSAQASPSAVVAQAAATDSLPSKLSDADYWKLVTDMSEPGGYFRIVDNFTSNEMEIGQLFTMIKQQKVSGGVYLGVGPEQNLSYIAAIRPKMAFLFDIRRQALLQHQMFKAIFELSPDRADFISMLFAKPRPAKLDSTTEIRAMWDAFWYVPTDTALASKNYAKISDRLIKTHGFTFTP